MQQLLKIAQASELLSLAQQTIYQMVCRDEIPHVKIGRALRFSTEDLEHWLENHKRVPKSEKDSNNNVLFPSRSKGIES